MRPYLASMTVAAWLALAVVTLGAGCTTRSPTGPSAPPATSATTTSSQPSPQPSPQSSPLPGPSETAPGRAASMAPADPVPARLGPQSAAGTGVPTRCLTQIEAFAELHSGSRVILGPAAFADSDQLVLTRMPRRGPDGLLLDGRAAPPQPVVLKLLAGPQGCVVRLADAVRSAAPAGPQAAPSSGSAPAGSGSAGSESAGSVPAGSESAGSAPAGSESAGSESAPSAPLPACDCIALPR